MMGDYQNELHTLPFAESSGSLLAACVKVDPHRSWWDKLYLMTSKRVLPAAGRSFQSLPPCRGRAESADGSQSDKLTDLCKWFTAMAADKGTRITGRPDSEEIAASTVLPAVILGRAGQRRPAPSQPLVINSAHRLVSPLQIGVTRRHRHAGGVWHPAAKVSQRERTEKGKKDWKL